MLAVAIPAYNRPECLRAALRSLENQTYKKFFTIVVDDCSTEDIYKVCKESTLNITYIRQKTNQGPGMARQKAIDMCAKSKIEFIIFLDSDDMLMPQAIEQLHYEITHSNSDMIASGISCEEDYKPFGLLTPPRNLTWHHGKIYRISALKKYNIYFNPELRTNEDLDFNLKVRLSPMKNGYIDHVTYLMRNDKNSICRGNTEYAEKVNNEDYITAVASVTDWAIKQNYDIHHNMINILNCYNFYQRMLIKNKDVTNVDKILKKLYNYKEVKEKLSNNYYWEKFDVSQYSIINKELKFFPQSIKEWLDHIEYRSL